MNVHINVYRKLHQVPHEHISLMCVIVSTDSLRHLQSLELCWSQKF